MPRKRQSKLKIGDIVGFSPDFADRGIIIDDFPWGQTAYWFVSKTLADYDEYYPCDGMKDRNICNNCEFNEICHKMQDIVKCDISEFARWRGEGKYDIDI